MFCAIFNFQTRSSTFDVFILLFPKLVVYTAICGRVSTCLFAVFRLFLAYFRLFLVYFRLFLVHFALRQSRILYILTTNSYFVKPYKLAKNGHKKSAAGNFYTPGRRIVLFFVCFRGYPSIEIIFFCSTAGFASFFGTNSFSRPCLNSALISSSVISSPT